MVQIDKETEGEDTEVFVTVRRYAERRFVRLDKPCVEPRKPLDERQVLRLRTASLVEEVRKQFGSRNGSP